MIYQVRVCPIGAASNEIVGAIAIFQNVTSLDRMELALSERNLAIARANVLLRGLARIFLDIQESDYVSSIYEILNIHLRQMDIHYFIAVLDPATDELMLEQISLELETTRRIEKAIGLTVRGYRFQRDLFPSMYDILNLKDGSYLSTTFLGQPGSPTYSGQKVFERVIQFAGLDSEYPDLPFPPRGGRAGARVDGFLGTGMSLEDLEPIRVFAGQVAWALERSDRYQREVQCSAELSRSNELLTVLATISAQMGTAQNTRQALDILGVELEKIGFHCLLGDIDDARENITFNYISFASKLGPYLGKVPGFKFLGHRLPKRLWPGGKVVTDGELEWYHDLVETFGKMFPQVPEVLFRSALKHIGIGPGDSLGILPLTGNGQVDSVLAILGRGIQEKDSPTLMIFANQAAEISNKTRGYEMEYKRANKLVRSNQMIMALSNVAASLGNSSNLAEVLDTLGRELHKTDVNCMVGTLDAGKQNLSVEYLSNYSVLSGMAKKLGIAWPEQLQIPRRLWPTDRAVLDKVPYWDPDPIESTHRMLPFVPKSVVRKSYAMAGMGAGDRVCYLPMIDNEDVLGISGGVGTEFAGGRCAWAERLRQPGGHLDPEYDPVPAGAGGNPDPNASRDAVEVRPEQERSAVEGSPPPGKEQLTGGFELAEPADEPIAGRPAGGRAARKPEPGSFDGFDP